MSQVSLVDHAADQRGDWLRQGVASAVLRREAVDAHELTVATERLHAQTGNAAFVEERQDVGPEAAKGAVERADRHLAGVPLEVELEHGAQDVGALVAGESDVANQAAFACLEGRLDCTARLKYPLGVVVVVDFVELPEVQIVHAQATQAVVQLCARGLGVPSADFGHQKHIVAAAL